MLNYHELTINEPSGSPQKRKQFIVICCIISFVIGNALINGGAFNSVRIGKGKFAGGEYVFKTMARDYPAFMGLAGTVGKDSGITESEHDGLIYTIFLDVDSSVSLPGGSTRFFSGVLNGKGLKKQLMAFNDDMIDVAEDAYVGDFNDNEKFGAHIKYESGSLPSVDAAVCQFVYTGGFTSALIYQYKVFPAMVKHAKEILPEGSPIVIASTCGIKDKICTHYIPLQKSDKFYLGGRPLTKEYVESLDDSKGLDIAAAFKSLYKVLGFGRNDTKSSAEEKEEL